jgi:WD40 repeat protein
MFRWFIFLVLLSAGAYFGIAYLTGANPLDPSSKGGEQPISAGDTTQSDEGTQRVNELLDIHIPLKGTDNLALRPVLVNGSRIVVSVKQEVSADRDGGLLFVGTELGKDEEKMLPPDRVVVATQYYLAAEVAYQPTADAAALSYPLAGEPDNGTYPKIDYKECFRIGSEGSRVFTRWKEGMPLYAKHVVIVPEVKKYRKLEQQEWVQKGQLLGQVDFRVALQDLYSKHAALEAAEADRFASAKTRDEAQTRYNRLVDLKGRNGVVSEEELSGALLTYQRYLYEEIAKREGVRKAAAELAAAQGVLRLHEVRAATDGFIKAIFKQRGDSANAKSSADPIMQIQDPRHLRADGLVELEDSRKLDKGQAAELEVSLPVQPSQDLKGHLQEVTAVAVNQGARRRIVFTAGEDRTLRGWDPDTGKEVFAIEVPAAIRSLACTPKTAKSDLLIAGLADGSVRILDLSQDPLKVVELPKAHNGAVLAVAFNADGTLCATAGDDRSIVLWSVADGKKLDSKINAHRAAITSLTFTSTGELLSAGKDNVLQVWDTRSGRSLVRSGEPFERRSGDVSVLGAFEDRILFDAGKELRVLSLKDRKRIDGVLRNPTGSSPFTTMALFSPDGKTVLTNGAVDGRLQLWRSPPRSGKGHVADPKTEGRGSELRHFVYANSPATCGAFDPDGKFAVTGMQDGHVLIWNMPTPEQAEVRVPATISMVGKDIEGSGSQVRVWAELKDPPPWLVPGSTATIVVLPKAKQ